MKRTALWLVIVAIVAFALLLRDSGSSTPLQPWHTVELTEEYRVDATAPSIDSFADYRALEDRLFQQLHDQVYAGRPTSPAHELERYSPGSAADPSGRQPNWNRSFELTTDNPVGGVVLLHGMSDSPYSLRTLGLALNQRGYQVIGMRMPGHGTAPSGLRHMSGQDMAGATRLAMEHLSNELGDKPIHMVGYSTGAALALNYTLNAIADADIAVPASVILISPAIRVHASSALAGFKDSLATLPGLDRLAYLSIMDEFDPYKYNSFATNAGAVVHRITVDVDRRIATMADSPAGTTAFPPVLVFKSAVDSTVTTEAVVDNLLARLPEGRNELVLFDINRHAAIKSKLLIADPAPLTDRLLAEPALPFAIRFITNEDPHSTRVVMRYKPVGSADARAGEALGLSWPRNVVSLSHVALPIRPDDPLYGREPPQTMEGEDEQIFLGDLAITGERGLIKIPGDWLLRLRYNPFYDYLEQRVLDWVEQPSTRQ